jgi:hypothetical protein
MRWSYYVAEPDANSIRVYIYNKDNITFFKEFSKSSFLENVRKDARNQGNTLNQVGFSYDVFCTALKSNDIHFELFDENIQNEYIPVRFMYRLLYVEGNFDWVMKMRRMDVPDEFIGIILQKNHIYQISFPGKVYIESNKEYSKDIIFIQNKLTDINRSKHINILKVTMKDGPKLLEFVADQEINDYSGNGKEMVRFLFINESFCQFVVNFWKRVYDCADKNNYFTRNKFEPHLKNLQLILEYSKDNISLEHLNSEFDRKGVKIYGSPEGEIRDFINMHFYNMKIVYNFFKSLYNIKDVIASENNSYVNKERPAHMNSKSFFAIEKQYYIVNKEPPKGPLGINELIQNFHNNVSQYLFNNIDLASFLYHEYTYLKFSADLDDSNPFFIYLKIFIENIYNICKWEIIDFERNIDSITNSNFNYLEIYVPSDKPSHSSSGPNEHDAKFRDTANYLKNPSIGGSHRLSRYLIVWDS